MTDLLGIKLRSWQKIGDDQCARCVYLREREREEKGEWVCVRKRERKRWWEKRDRIQWENDMEEARK